MEREVRAFGTRAERVTLTADDAQLIESQKLDERSMAELTAQNEGIAVDHTDDESDDR